MKSIIIAFIASFLMLADLKGQWKIVRDIIYINYTIYRDICFLNQDKGFITVFAGNGGHGRGALGTISMTNDGGKTWKSVFSKLGERFYPCIFTDNSNGFIGSISGLYQTSDGGASWVMNSSAPSKIKDIFFVNEQIGFIAADTSIYKSTNGGDSWERILYCNGLSSIFFIDEITGWAVGESGLIMKLTDKGTSEKIPSGTTLPLTKVFFADRNTGWIAGGYNNASDGLHPVLLKTVNGGGSWFKIENVNWMIRDFYFRNDREGWAVGVDSTGLGMIIETNNGGNNWSVQVDTLRVPLIATDFKDGYGWAIGNGIVLKKDFSIISGIKEDNEIYNSNTILFENFPNPFSSETTIKYQLPAISNIDLNIYNITGHKIKTLVNERQQAGLYEIEWNTEGMTPGIYFCELKAGQTRKVLKMILMK